MHSKRRRAGGSSRGGGGPQPRAPSAAGGAVRAEKPPARRRRMFRWVAMGFAPILALAALECGLRWIGFGYPARYLLESKEGGEDRCRENQQFTRRFFPPSLTRHPMAMSFARRKPESTWRVFLMGESAAQGDPEPAFGMGRFLEVLLRERFPDVRIEVLNTGITAVNSHVIRELAADCARETADAWVLYMGNNEVVGPYGAGTVFGRQAPSRFILSAGLWLKEWRIGQAMDELRRLAARSEPPLRSWGGMEMFREHEVAADDPRLDRVRSLFRDNLEAVVRSGQACGARVLVGTVGVNVRDCAPFASRHGRALGEAELAAWDRAFAAGAKAEEAGLYADALSHYAAAARADDGHAELAFRMARCMARIGRIEEARPAFHRAIELDALRFRADARINETIRHTASGREPQGIYLLDVAAGLARSSPDELPGREFFFEHVHLTPEGNYRVGRQFAEKMAEWIRPRSAQDRGQWLDFDSCARRLALTPWNRHAIHQALWERMQRAPYTSQCDRLEREHRCLDALAQLRPYTKSYGTHRAISACRQEILGQPDDLFLRQNLARLLQASGDSEGALAAWRDVLDRLPHHPEAWLAHAVLLDELGRGSEAGGSYRRAVECRPAYGDAWAAWADSLVRRQDWKAAERALSRAIALDPASAGSWLNLGLLHSYKGSVREAQACFERSLTLHPASAEANLELGRLALAQHRHAEAERYLREALRIDPDLPGVQAMRSAIRGDRE